MRHVLATVAVLVVLAASHAAEKEGEEQSPQKPKAEQSDSPPMSDEEQGFAEAEKQKCLEEIDEKIKEAQRLLKVAEKSKDKAERQARTSSLSGLRKQKAALLRLPQKEYLEKHFSRKRSEAQAALKIEKENARYKAAGPLYIDRMGIVTNVIGVPELVLVVKNTTSQTVEAFDVSAECQNKFGEAVIFPGQGNVFSGTYQEKIMPGGTATVRWQLSLQRNTTKAWTWVKRVKMADGSVWQQTKAEAESKRVGFVLAETSK